jgi:hypothetical protein
MASEAKKVAWNALIYFKWKKAHKSIGIQTDEVSVDCPSRDEIKAVIKEILLEEEIESDYEEDCW